MAGALIRSTDSLDLDSVILDASTFAERQCKKVEEEDGYAIYEPWCNITHKDSRGWLQKQEIGQKDKRQRGKVVMVVGETGAGKSTLINAMFNHMLGVKFDDPFRFRLIQEDMDVDVTQSVTQHITAYTIHHQPWFEVPYTVTVIDTPGFGDTKGILKDEEIKKQIYAFFSTKGAEGIDILDAVGFVVKATDTRLTKSQHYIFEQVLSLFGSDIAGNIFILATHSEMKKKAPKVMNLIKSAEVPYSDFFQFSYGSLFDLERDDIGKKEWSYGEASFQAFCNLMDLTEPKSLWQTREVLQKREELEDALRNIQESIKMGVTELQTLKKEKEFLEKYQHDMEANKNYKYEALEHYVEEQPLRKGQVAVNCRKCTTTCLTTKFPWTPETLSECWIFRPTSFREKGFCNRCSKGCSSSEHEIAEVTYSVTTRTVMRTLDDLKKNYEEAQGKTMTSEQIVAECQERIVAVQKETVLFTMTARSCINTLNDIALKPDPLSTEDYIDLMISEEKHRAGDDFKKKIKILEGLKKMAQLRKKLSTYGKKEKSGQASAAVSNPQQQICLASDEPGPPERKTTKMTSSIRPEIEADDDPMNDDYSLTYEVELKKERGSVFRKMKKAFKKIGNKTRSHAWGEGTEWYDI